MTNIPPPYELPAMRDRKPKRIKVRVMPGSNCYGVSYKRKLTYHVYGPRPKRGQMVMIEAGIHAGKTRRVARRWSLYRGETCLARIVRPVKWS